MKKKWRIILIALLVMCASCSLIQVEAFAKTKSSSNSQTIYVGGKLNLAKQVGSGINKNAIKWTSSKKSVASVNKKGLVTAKKAGKTVIKASIGSKSVSVNLTVKKVALSDKALALNVGDSKTITLNGSSIKSVKTSNKSVATISKKGKVTAKAVGTAKLTVVGKNKKKYTCKVTVTEKSSLTSDQKKEDNTDETNKKEEIGVAAINLIASKTTLESESDSLVISYSLSPENVNHSYINWSCDDYGVLKLTRDAKTGACTCTINKAFRNQKVKVTATDKYSNVTACIDIQVGAEVAENNENLVSESSSTSSKKEEIPVSAITLSASKTVLETEEDSLTISYSLIPENVNHSYINWSCDDYGVLKLTRNAETGACTCTINKAFRNQIVTVTATDKYTNVTASIDIQVGVDLTGIIVGSTVESINSVRDTCDFSSGLIPSNATNTLITYSSSDEEILTVDETTGKVTSIGYGKEYVTVTATDKKTGISGEKKIYVNTQYAGLNGSSTLAATDDNDYDINDLKFISKVSSIDTNDTNSDIYARSCTSITTIGNYAYASMDDGGVYKFDYTDPSNPVYITKNTDVNEEVDGKHMQVYDVVASGNYIYTASRTASGSKSTSSQLYINHDSGLSKVCDAGTQTLNSSVWDYKSFPYGSTYADARGEKSPLGGRYGCVMTYKTAYTKEDGSLAHASCYVTKKLESVSKSNYIMFDYMVESNENSTPGKIFYFSVFNNDTFDEENNEVSARQRLLSFKVKIGKNNTYTITPLVKTSADTSANTLLEANAYTFKLDSWYTFKIKMDTEGTKSNIEFDYKTTNWEDWSVLAKVDGVDTGDVSINAIDLGFVNMDSAMVGQKIHFDEVYYDTRDLDKLVFNQGRVDVIDPNTMEIVNTFHFNSKCSRLYMTGNYLFVGCQRGGVAMFEIKDEAKPKFLGMYKEVEKVNSGCEMHGMQYFTKTDEDGNLRKYLTVACFDRGLTILDVTNPADITKVLNFDFTNDRAASIWDCTINYPYLYCTVNLASKSYVGTDDDHRGIVVFDLTNVSSSMTSEEKSSYTYLTRCELPDSYKSAHGVNDGDVRPSLITRYGHYLYLAGGTAGLVVYDISNPEKPELVANKFDQFKSDVYCNSIWAVHVSEGGKIFACDGRITDQSEGNIIKNKRAIYLFEACK